MIRRVNVKLEFKLQDMWIGIFWKGEQYDWHTSWLHIWICILPMFPIHIIIEKEHNKSKEE